MFSENYLRLMWDRLSWRSRTGGKLDNEFPWEQRTWVRLVTVELEKKGWTASRISNTWRLLQDREEKGRVEITTRISTLNGCLNGRNRVSVFSNFWNTFPNFQGRWKLEHMHLTSCLQSPQKWLLDNNEVILHWKLGKDTRQAAETWRTYIFF